MPPYYSFGMKDLAVAELKRLWELESDTSSLIEALIEGFITEHDPERREYWWMWFGQGLMTRKIPSLTQAGMEVLRDEA